MTPDPRCDQTFFCVEANSNETHYIWRELCDQRGVHWRQDSGVLETVGHIKIGNENLPVCVCLMWNWIRGKLICFYDATSRVVDHQMIEDYLKANVIKDKTWGGGRIIKTDATNYHMMWHAIEESQVLWNDVLKHEPFSFKNLNDLGEALWNRGVRQLPDRKAGEIFWGPTDKCKCECGLTPTDIKWLNQKLDLLTLNTVST